MIAPLETLETLNTRLKEHFGLFEDGRPNWRIVWSTDEMENRLTEYTKEGFVLPRPEIRLMKKYPFSQDRYILERLMGISHGDLTTKTSYEPLWTFEDANGNPLPPDWEVCKILIDTVQINILAAGHIPPETQPFGEGNTPEEMKYKAEQLVKNLFGNDTPIGDSLAMDSAVGYGTRKRSDWVN